MVQLSKLFRKHLLAVGRDFYPKTIFSNFIWPLKKSVEC